MPERTHGDDRDLYRELDESIRRNGNISAALDEFIAKHGGNRENLAQYVEARAGGYSATAPGCGTKAAILALLPLTATLAAWIGGWPC